MRIAVALILVVGLANCNESRQSGKWREVQSTSTEARFERANAICKGRAAETQIAAGRLWIAGAVASDKSFQACMAEQGFIQD